MRRIYIFQETSDDAKKIAATYYNSLIRNQKLYNMPRKISDTMIECGRYQIFFLTKRQWQIKMSEAPESGYLTIPYNRFLLSKQGGVPSDQCNLKGLQKLLIDDKEKNGEE